MKRHPIDYFSLIAGFGFGAIAIATLTDRSWFGLDSWNGRWIGPIILISLGLVVLAPKRTVVSIDATGAHGSLSDPGPDTVAAAHDELPPAFMDDDLPTDDE